jgi:hypothetical protein
VGANPSKSFVLGRATIFVGAAGCAMLCFRAARLLAVGLALGLKKRGRCEKKKIIAM